MPTSEFNEEFATKPHGANHVRESFRMGVVKKKKNKRNKEKKERNETWCMVQVSMTPHDCCFISHTCLIVYFITRFTT